MKFAVVLIAVLSIFQETIHSSSGSIHGENQIPAAFQPDNHLAKEEQIKNTLIMITATGDYVTAVLKFGITMIGKVEFYNLT